MPDSDVPSLPPVTNIYGNEYVYVVQNGEDHCATPDQLTGGLKRARVEVSSAEILTLNSSPVDLTPTPDAGKVIELWGGTSHTAAGSSASPHRGFVAVECGGEPYLDEGIYVAQGFSKRLVPAAVTVSSATADAQPLTLVGEVTVTGGIASLTIDNGGTGYEVGDTGGISDPGSGATYVVDSVDGLGAITALTITAPGDSYGVGDTPSTDTSGVGEDLVVTVDSLTDPSDGTLVIDLLYRIVDLP